MVIALGGAFSKPIVVFKDKFESCFAEGSRGTVEITDNDISEFIKRWIVIRFQWDSINEERLIKNISPFTTEGLLSKIREQFRTGAEKEFKDKSVSADVSKNIRITLTKDKVIAQFDRIIRIGGVPLVDPAEMSFSLVEGTKTKFNPYGIYINGITEHKTSE